MRLYQMLYCSQRNQNVDFELERLVKNAGDRNREKNVTGALWTTGNYIVQVLEGSRKDLSEIFMKIYKDRRHKNIELMSVGEITKRRFPKWGFGVLTDTEKNRSIVLKYSTVDKINPYTMNADSMLMLMEELANNQPN
ncbi:MAG: BLUF domain-containing protein [Alphaproteobacteria bacterium]|nr:BLUF domain-containing protein [Alphaproteobacteria bacterium]